MRRLLKKCLEKDPARRLRDVGDAWELLDEAPVATAAPVAPSRLGRVAWAVASLTTLALGAVSFIHFREKLPAPPDLRRFEIPTPDKTTIQKFAVSPDGRTIAFYAIGADGRGSLWVRSLDSVESRRVVARTEASPSITWSPDSRFMAFPAGEGLHRLMKVAVSGGPPQIVCEIKTIITGGSWNLNDVIVFGSFGSGVWRVSAAGGAASPVTALDASRQEVGASTPVFLPDGHHFLYLRESRVVENSGLYLGSLDAKPEHQGLRRLVATNFSPVYAPSADPSVGYVVFRREDALLAQPLDLAKLEMVGEPVVLANHVGSTFEFGNAGASTNGVLAYRSGNSTGANWLQPAWFDRLGKNLGAAMAPRYYYSLGLSPDAARVAVTRLDLGSGEGGSLKDNGVDIWLHEFGRNTLTRFTFDKTAYDPVWSADGTHVAYVSARPSGIGLYQKASNGAGGEEIVLQPSGDRDLDDWSRDGRFLLYSQVDAKSKSDLWVVPLAGDRKPTVYLNSEFNETQAQFSPDGHWITYVSDESGHPEIYVRPFPLAAGGGSKWTVSNDGGVTPRWRRDGKELFYLAANDRTVMAADVSYTPSFKTGVPAPLFNPTMVNIATTSGSNGFNWDVTADGKRFLVITAAALQDTSQSPITVVLNWTALMKK